MSGAGRIIKRFWARFSREEGTATIEFVILLPVFMFIFVSTFEIGMAMTRLTMLERGLDLTMRDIRLGTDETFTHTDIRNSICDRASILHDCRGSLQVEMVVIDAATWVMPQRKAQCVDRSETAEPVIELPDPEPNDTMFIRACILVTPIFPAMGIGAMMDTDANGEIQLIAAAAFSQEP